MSIADSFAVVVVNESSSKPDGDPAPHYAMKVALETLKDRCTKLQTRVSYLEDENLQLRVAGCKAKDPIEEDTVSHLISDNKSEKSNGNYWVKVSKRDTGKSQLSKNIINSNRAIKSSSMSDPIVSSCLKNEDLKVKEDSLEEISLRGGAFGINLSKERIDCDVGNDSGEYGEDNLESLDMALKDVMKKMKRDQEILRQQQEGLKTALDLFKKVIKDKQVCQNCLKREEGVKGRENKIVGTEDSLMGRSEVEGFRTRERIRVPIPSTDDAPPLPLKDRICPLCEKYFHCTTPFDTFNEHVLSHFVEEEEDGDVPPKFEVIT